MAEKSSIEFIFESGYKSAIDDIKILLLEVISNNEFYENAKDIRRDLFRKLIEQINKMYCQRYLEKGIKV